MKSVTTENKINIASFVFVWTEDCGVFTEKALDQMETCGFYIEGIALAILGSFAIISNIFTLYVFLRYVI